MRRLVLFAGLVAATWSASSGQESRLATQLAPYVPSPKGVVELMLDLARVKPGDTVYDLGSGDGRVLIAAAERGANAVGIEINPKLVTAATQEISRARPGVAARAKVIQGDVMTADFSPATVVTLYMDRSFNEKLRPRLEKHLKPGSRVVSHDYEIPGWKATRVVKTEENKPHTIYLYEIPAQKN